MTYLVNTNVAFRLILQSDPQHSLATSALSRLRKRGETVCITAQIMLEFQALATRPLIANGLGMAPAQATLEAKRLEAILPLLPDIPTIYPAWRILADSYGVIGRQVFDARLVAVMQEYGVSHLLTFNAKHFRQFSGIMVVEPKNVK